MTPLLVGIGLGFTVAASFGPINVFSLSSGLRYGFWPAFGVALGATAADGLYAFLGGLGVAALFTGSAGGWFQILGGAVLIVLAARMARPKSLEGERRVSRGFGRSFVIALGATLANPITIVYWAGAFAGIVPRFDLSRAEALVLLPLGVVVGGVCWATVLASGSAFAGRYVGERLLAWVSVASALTIGAFGVWFVVGGVRAFA
jgi:threonine/homoserine/homoserine lactone efflux protein